MGGTVSWLPSERGDPCSDTPRSQAGEQYWAALVGMGWVGGCVGGKEGLIGHVSTIPLSKLEQHWGLFPNSDSWFE